MTVTKIGASRSEVINGFFFLKRAARKNINFINMCRVRSNILRRHKRLLEHRNSAFDKHRIEELEANASLFDSDAEPHRKFLIDLGEALINVLPYADRFLSFHDKCQILGVNHIEALSRLSGDKSISIEKMIFVHCLEYRGKDDCLPSNDISMPLWNVYRKRLLHELETNTELREASNRFLDDFLAGVPKYRLEKNPDGSETLVRMPPKLKLMVSTTTA